MLLNYPDAAAGPAGNGCPLGPAFQPRQHDKPRLRLRQAQLFEGLMISLSDWSFAKYAPDQLKKVVRRLRLATSETRCTNSHMNQAIKP